MASKVFLDANVLLDLTLKRDGYEQSTQIFELIVNGTIKGFISSSIIHVIGYFISKAYGNIKAKELLLTIMADITVIDLPHETVLNALHSKINDIEDSLQYYTAIHHKLDYFISSDKQLQKQSIPGLPVLSPKDFLIEIS
ncbi:MAG: PIN domain-containing protein [Bacteroidota bacterium]